jgi:hypothetical protein
VMRKNRANNNTSDTSGIGISSNVQEELNSKQIKADQSTLKFDLDSPVALTEL